MPKHAEACLKDASSIREAGSSLSAEAIYQAYPRKVARKAALKAIRAALKARPASDLMAATRAYSEAVSRWSADQRQYVPHPATWFNRGSYDDAPEEWRREGKNGHKPADSPFALVDQTKVADIYTEIPGWREKAIAKWPDVELPATWSELPIVLRNDLAQDDRCAARAVGAFPLRNDF